MPRLLGDAFVTISPDTSLFRTMADAEVRKAIAGMNPQITLGVDTSGVTKAVADMQAKMAALSKTLAQMRVDADTTPAVAQIAALQAKLAALAKTGAQITMQADTTKLDAQIAAEMAKLATLRQQASDLQMDADTAKAAAKIAALQKQASDLYDKLDKLEADVDINAALTKIYAIEAELRVLQSDAKTVEFGAKADALNAAIAASISKIAVLKAEARDIQLGDNIDTGKLLAVQAGLLSIEAAMEKLNDTGEQTNGIWQALTARFTQAGIGWTATIGGIAGWHIVLDAAIEAAISLGTATLALGAAAAVTAPALDQVGYNTEHMLQAMTALGDDAGPLAGKLDAIQAAMAPQVIEAYGGALSLLTGQAGALSKVGAEVVTMVDDWVAKLDLWAKGQNDISGLLQTGAGYLAQFVKFFAILGQAIDNLLTKDPGIAHFLLDFLQGIAELINLFSQLPAPIVEGTLALHGLYLWGSVLLGVLTKMTEPLVSMVQWITKLGEASQAAAKAEALQTAMGEAATAAGEEEEAVTGLAAVLTTARTALASFGEGLLALAANPLTWVVAAAAAIAYMTYQFRQGTSAAKDFVNGLNSSLANENASQAILSISTDIGELNTRIRTAFSAQNINAIQQTFSGIGLPTFKANLIGIAGVATSLGDTFRDAFSGKGSAALHDLSTAWDYMFSTKHTDAIHQAGNDVRSYNAELVMLTAQQDNLFRETGSLINQGYTYEQAIGLMDAAGVKASDSFELMHQKVQNLISGYQDMSIQSGILANSVNALNFQTEQQDSKVTQLNDAWDTFFKTVSGGASGFDAFATQAEGLYDTLSSSSDKFSISNGKASISLQATTSAATGTAVSMTGLNTASLQARDAFIQTATAANSQLDALTLQASAAGLGTKGTVMLTQATKDMVAQMLPAAKGSQEMTAVLYALAQRGGYQGADSFQQLAKWVGNNQAPMQNLDKITTTLTVDSANLTKDVQNLSVALGTNLNDAMAAAIMQASGGQKVYNAFADAVLNTGKNSKTTQEAAVPLEQSLLRMTGNASDAKSEFETFAQEGLGLTKTQADKLWQETFPKAQQSMKDMASTSKSTSDQMTSDSKKAQTQAGLWQGVFQDITNWGKDAWQPVSGAASKAFDDIKNYVATNFDGWWKSHGDSVKDIWLVVTTYISTRWDQAIHGLTSDWDSFSGTIKHDWTDLTNWFADASPLRKAITGAFQGVYEAVLPIFQAMGSAFVGVFKTGADLVTAAFRLMFNNMTAGLKIAWDTAVVIFDEILDLMTGRWGQAWTDMKNYAIQVWHALNTEADKDWGIIEQLGIQIWNNIFMPFVRLAQSSWDSFAKEATQSFDSAYDSFKSSLLNPLTSFFTRTFPSWLDDIGRFFKNLWIAAWQDFYNNDVSPWITLFTKTFPGWLDAIGRFFKNVWVTVWQDFYNENVSPWTTLFTKTFPGWLDDIGRFFKNLWVTVWQDLYNEDISPWTTLFTKTFPGWLDAIERFFKNLWDTAWQDFYNEDISPWTTLFTKTFPGWLDAIGRFFKNLWVTVWQDLYNEDISPWTTLFTKTFPDWLDDIGRFFKNLWVTIWQDLYNEDISPWTTLFTKTFPDWLDAIGRFFSNLWTYAWQEFYNQDIAPWITLFTRTFPGWLDGLGRAFTSLWDLVRTYFTDHVSDPVSTAIGSWANDITAAFKTGWNSVANWFNNNIINWINNNILHHLPGNLSIGHIPTFASGGQAPGTGAGDTVPALLTPGEWVIRKPAVAAMEKAIPGVMAQLNTAEQWLHPYAAGGPVSTKAPSVDPRDIASGRWVHHPGHGNAPYDFRAVVIPKFATGGQVEQTMLDYMLSKKGDAYSEANRWGRPPFDCSSLLWSAASAAGVPIPQSEAIANTEAEWLSKYDSDFTYTSRNQIQTGDILFFTGAAPDASPWGGIGHVGMAASPDVLISALGTQYGVTESGIGDDFVAGIRLGGSGGKGLFAQIWGAITGLVAEAWQSTEGLLDSAGTGLGSLISPLTNFVTGGAKELLSLAKQGAQPIFDFIWNQTIAPLLRTIPGDTMPSAFLQETASEIKTGIDSFFNQQDIAAQQTAAASSGGGFTPGAPATGSAAAAQKFAQGLLASYGWGANEWPPLLALWDQESGWNANAVNPSSGAYGIPQALGKGHPYNLGDYANQIRWGLSYIQQRYGTPAAAEDHELTYHWYDQGGWLPPGVSMAVNNTGQPELVTPASGGGPGPMTETTGQAICARLDRLISLASSAPASYAQALSGVAGRSAARGYYGG
jgi:Bacteriophage peptidoglycan hydrolase